MGLIIPLQVRKGCSEEQQGRDHACPCRSPLPAYNSTCRPLCTAAGSPCRARVRWLSLAERLKFKREEGVVIQSLNKHSISILDFRPKQVQQCASYSEST